MLYWELIAATGWSFEYLDDAMTLPRVFSLMKGWEMSPPVHRMIAQYLGTGKQAEKPEQQNDLGQLVGMPGFEFTG